jgi:hypothetical protein
MTLIFRDKEVFPVSYANIYILSLNPEYNAG